MSVVINLGNDNFREFPKSSTVMEIARTIKPSFSKEAIIGVLDGVEVDLNTRVEKDSDLRILTFKDERGQYSFWHSSTHLLAQAVTRLWPDAKLGTGPAIENGFYYDIDLEHKITEEDFPKIEAEMKKIVKEALEIERIVLSKEEAIELLEKQGQHYKIELIEKWGDDAILSFYKQGEFIDLCTGPHVPNTKYLKQLKVLSVAGAYWQADANNKMLQRIYGISFEKKKDLDAHLYMLEQAKLRDHRKLGKELGLFVMKEQGPGFPFFLPKGIVLKNEIIKFWREVHDEYEYVEIETPMMLNRDLWQTSGHWDHYRENMYTLKIDDEDYAIKPMNCPGGMLAYQTEIHSYREFPWRVAELGKVHRYELSGALHGLMRVRAFTQDDAHIFLMPNQIKDEVKNIISLVDRIYKVFGFEYSLELSTRPEDFLGEIEDWDRAEKSLSEAITEAGYEFKINEGDGAFYGPKIDFQLKDCLGRTWQCATIQLDYQLPEKFDLTYIGPDGEKHRPTMLHRVALGSFERFIGILIEHYAGRFPTWIAPVQARVLPISDKYMGYAKNIFDNLKNNKIRIEIDTRAEKIGYKIREAQVQQIPYMVIIGEKEVEENKITVRDRNTGKSKAMTLEEFRLQILREIAERTNK